jgi:hypothetical protein
MAAPGYDMYYLNVMAGPGRRVWPLCDDPAHERIRGSRDGLEVDLRLPLTSAGGDLVLTTPSLALHDALKGNGFTIAESGQGVFTGAQGGPLFRMPGLAGRCRPLLYARPGGFRH